ncbi:MAG TPA: 3-phosphoshikimate 1-carboxyvinyltransferase, partial [Candidatus Marinimicrobia bacterium]|nr:3-phosphoshikimate 1-carboxyvinyltransferase [Candidatus Neomarinimicrobiota bacterium]
MRIKGEISLPGDKSISHRALMFASLTDGECVIHNISTGEDVESTRKCLAECDIQSVKSGNTVRIKGGVFSNPDKPLNCGNSGTTIRLLAGLLAGKRITAEFTGDDSLAKRPMSRIIDPLTEMGVVIESINGHIPFTIKPKELNGISFVPSVASAQVKSCIMLAGLGAIGQTVIDENVKTRDHSEIISKELGAPVSSNGTISINPLSRPLQPFEINVPGDPSSAAFFAAAAALIPNSSITIKNVLANPTRIGFFQVLKKMGGGVEWQNMRKECGESVGDVHVFWEPLNGIDITSELVPSVIDELPIIAVLATQA